MTAPTGPLFQIEAQRDGTYAVKIRQTDGSSTLATGFSGKAEAEAWVAKQQAGPTHIRAHHQRLNRTAKERTGRSRPPDWNS